MKNTPVKIKYKVERKTADPNGWYEVMLSPFNTLKDCLSYIEKYRQCYPINQQNYKITEQPPE